ncbi:MAG: Hsp20/alpha crystallin family protein [Paracoccaceae bacterium]
MVESTPSTGFWPTLADPLRTAGTRLAEWVSPAAEAKREDDAYSIRMEIPGVKTDDVDVSVHDGVVTVKGEKKLERSEEGDSWFFSERQYGGFQRSFRLPPDAEEDGVKADVNDGVLLIHVPRRTSEDGGARRIPIGG